MLRLLSFFETMFLICLTRLSQLADETGIYRHQIFIETFEILAAYSLHVRPQYFNSITLTVSVQTINKNRASKITPNHLNPRLRTR